MKISPFRSSKFSKYIFFIIVLTYNDNQFRKMQNSQYCRFLSFGHLTYHQHSIADHNFTVSMRQPTFGQSGHIDPVGTIFKRWRSHSTGNTETQTLSDLISNQSCMQRYFMFLRKNQITLKKYKQIQN